MNYIGIFEGGGVKGIAHIGALRALEERGFFCKKASGTSVGAIIASLVVAGYSSIELTNILFNLISYSGNLFNFSFISCVNLFFILSHPLVYFIIFKPICIQQECYKSDIKKRRGYPLLT